MTNNVNQTEITIKRQSVKKSLFNGNKSDIEIINTANEKAKGIRDSDFPEFWKLYPIKRQ